MLGMSSSRGGRRTRTLSTLTASQPSFSAVRACRTDVPLWNHRDAGLLELRQVRRGLRPAVSMIRTPESAIAWMYSCYCGWVKLGRKVRLSANG